MKAIASSAISAETVLWTIAMTLRGVCAVPVRTATNRIGLRGEATSTRRGCALTAFQLGLGYYIPETANDDRPGSGNRSARFRNGFGACVTRWAPVSKRTSRIELSSSPADWGTEPAGAVGSCAVQQKERRRRASGHGQQAAPVLVTGLDLTPPKKPHPKGLGQESSFLRFTYRPEGPRCTDT